MDSPEDTILTGSDSDLCHSAFYCQPCETDGTLVTAVGYCNNCKEYLCQRCYDVHLIPSVTRKHVLALTEHSRDSEKHETATYQMKCEQHKGKTIKYHCPSHSFLGCHICFFKDHRNCTDVKFIPDVAKDVTSTEEYREFNATLTWVAANCGELVARMEAYERDIDNSQHETIRVFQAHKKEVLDAIDNLEKQFIEKVENFKREESMKIYEVKDIVQGLLSENQGIAIAIERLQAQKQDCELYRTMVKRKERLTSLQTELLDAQSSIRERKLVSNLIYVSKYNKNELLCLKFDGSLVCRYNDNELAGPWQAVVDSSGTVYVCGRSSNNVHEVTGDCQKVRVLLSAADGLKCPESISYDEREGRVYIGQDNYDFVKVYNVTSEQI